MKSRLRAIGILVAWIALGAGLFKVLFTVMDLASTRRGAIVVGGKAFTESTILGEIMAQWIEFRTGLRVERRFDLGGTNICFEALRTGHLDLYAEYTGTGLMAILHRPVNTDPAAVLHIVGDEFPRTYQVAWLDPFGFDNTYAIAVPRSLAQRYALHAISDLIQHPELRVGFASEFLARDDGWPGLRARYGLRFSEDPRAMEAGLMYQAAGNGQIDVISAYSTDGRIDSMHLVVLQDDRHFFPPYQAAPIVREETLRLNPAVRSALRELHGVLDEATMRRMNFAVDSGQKSPSQVAAEFVRLLRHR